MKRAEGQGSPKGRRIDVAIVGDGIAGLYAGSRITEAWSGEGDTQPRVHLFEATDRLGGRLLSIDIPRVHFPMELGAMRYKSSHRLLAGLIRRFKIEVRPFGFSDPRLFLRGRHDTLKNLAKGTYRLTKEEKTSCG